MSWLKPFIAALGVREMSLLGSLGTWERVSAPAGLEVDVNPLGCLLGFMGSVMESTLTQICDCAFDF